MATSSRSSLVVRKALSLALVSAMLAPVFPRLAVAQPAGLPELGDSSADELSPRLERRLGEAVMYQYQRDPDFIQDADVRQYLTTMGTTLAAHAPGGAPYDIQVFAVRDPSINAFAMPGGFIGVNAGLVVAAESESELAGVLAHEIGHVVQRHVARGLVEQKKGTLIMAAALIAALIAARGSSQAPEAALAFGQAATVDSQLGFSRDAEREADRAGFAMLSATDFNIDGMAGFFARLIQMSGLNESTSQVFTRTHPLSLDRMSDMQNRARNAPVHHHVDSPDFYFVRAKLRILQAGSDAQETLDAIRYLESRARNTTGIERVASLYGVAIGWMKRRDYVKARQAFEQASGVREHFMLARLGVDLALADGDAQRALELAQLAYARWPEQSTVAYAVAECLQRTGRNQETIGFLQQQIGKWGDEARLYQMEGESYDKAGNAVAARRNMAEYYVLTGALPTAVELLQQARTASKDFYEQSQIDARIRELQRRVKEEEELLKRFKS